MSFARPALFERFPDGEWPVEVEKYIEDRCRLRYHQGASRAKVETLARRLIPEALEWSEQQRFARSTARRASAVEREEKRRGREKNPLPASLDLAAIARRSLERYPGHKPTQRDVAWLAERLKLAWHQGESVEELTRLADRLGGGSPASRQQMREEAERAGGGG